MNTIRAISAAESTPQAVCLLFGRFDRRLVMRIGKR